jgi:hypothetical protein
VTLIRNTFEGGTSGNSVTVATTATPDALYEDPTTTAATIAFSDAQATSRGSLSAKYTFSNVSGNAYCRWNQTGARTTVVRFYIYVTTRPSTTGMGLVTLTSSTFTNKYASLVMNTSGQIALYDYAGGYSSPNGDSTFSTTAIPLDTWYRVEFSLDNSGGTTAGAAVVKCYVGDGTSEVAGLSWTMSSKNYGGANFANVALGRYFGTTANGTPTYHVDDFGWDTGTLTLLGVPAADAPAEGAATVTGVGSVTATATVVGVLTGVASETAVGSVTATATVTGTLTELYPSNDLFPADTLYPEGGGSLPVVTVPGTASAAGVGSVTATASVTEPAPPSAAPINVRVRINFSGTTWTDITSYVLLNRAFTMTAGRADTDEYVQPGRLSGMVLNNADGRFTVGNAAGAYYPNVRSGKEIQVDIQNPVTNAWVPRFYGRIDGWPMTWTTGGTRCLTMISATDMLGDWANRTAPPYMGWEAARIDTADSTATLTSYRSLTELAADGTLGGLVQSGLAPTQFGEAGPAGDPRPLLKFTSNSWSATWQGWLTAAGYYGVSFWVKVDSPPGYCLIPLSINDDAGYGVGVDIHSDAVWFSQIDLGTGAITHLTAVNVPIIDGKWHLVSIAVQRNDIPTAQRAWVGVDGGWGAAYTGSAQITANYSNKKAVIGKPYSPAGDSDFTFGHMSTWTISAFGLQDILSLYMSGWGLPSYATTSGAASRLYDIAALSGLPYPVPSGTRTGIANSSPVGNALDLARLVEDTDGGVLWADGSGSVRYSGARGTPSPVTITAADVSPGVLVAADGVKIRNSITLTNRSVFNMEERTATVAVSDSASIAIWGVRAREITTAWVNPGSDPNYLTTRANELLVTSEDPRIPTLPIDLLTLPDASKSTMLGLTVGSALQVTDLPSVGGFPSSLTMWVEGWSETVGAAQWSATYNMSPA